MSRGCRSWAGPPVRDASPQDPGGVGVAGDESWKATIDGWQVADREAPRKQRHTARRVWQRLVDEHGAQVCASRVRRHAAEARRRHLMVLAEVVVPQRYVLGTEAEVDFGRVHVVVSGVETDAWMFVVRLPPAGRGFHRVYRHEAQQAFRDGHVRGLEHFAAWAHGSGTTT